MALPLWLAFTAKMEEPKFSFHPLTEGIFCKQLSKISKRYIQLLRREGHTALWPAAWLGISPVFAIGRFFYSILLKARKCTSRYRHTADNMIRVACVGPEFAKTFIGFRPPRCERSMIMLLVAGLIFLRWSSNQILLTRTLPGGSNGWRSHL